METSNLELWNKVGTTTKETKTKEVSYGSRKFTAIDAYSQIKTATEQFGKYGEKWGFKEIKYDIIEGKIYFIGTFFYPSGTFPIFNDAKVGEDGAKKVFTDSLTKALSYLGFNADVFMGKFEGNKYTGKSDDKNPETDKRDLLAIINDMKASTTQEDIVKFKEEGKLIAKTDKQKEWLKRDYEKMINNLK